MQWELILALVIAIPIILFPAAYIWYVNIGGIYAAVKQRREKRAAEKAINLNEAVPQEQEYEKALRDVLEKQPWNR